MKYNHSLTKPSLLSLALFSAACITGPTALAGDDAASLADAFSEGDAAVVLRYRYELVDQDNILLDADASTLKTRLNFKTKSWNDFTFFIEADNVTDLLADDYNSTSNGKTAYSVVADPIGTDLNQAWVQYNGFDKTSLKYGRQRVVLDNQRFVGGVAWRQNEQTYDAFTVTNKSIEDLTTSLSYVWNVNRIFGPEGPKADVDSETILLNMGYTGFSFGKLSFYGYLVDNVDTPTANTQTFGVRLAGKVGANKAFNYELEYADQSDYDGRLGNFSADYLHVKGGYNVSGINLGIGMEILSGDATTGQAFSTPLATLHKFNGWADQFLGTPSDGLEDVYASFSTKLSDYKLTVVYHDFSANDSGNDYGSELDIAVARKISKNYSVLFKYAGYSAGDSKVDTNKFWVMVTASY